MVVNTVMSDANKVNVACVGTFIEVNFITKLTHNPVTYSSYVYCTVVVK